MIPNAWRSAALAGAWIGAAAILVAGYARISTVDVPRIAAVEDRARALDREILISRQLLHRRFALRAARQRILADIRAQSEMGAGQPAAALLALDASARRAGVAVVSVTPVAAKHEAGVRWLRASAMTFAMRGPYAALLRFLTAYPRLDPMVRFDDLTVAASARRSLEYTIRATTYEVVGVGLGASS